MILNTNEIGLYAAMEGVLSVIPNHILKLHTTRSWDFMGFSHSDVAPAQEGHVVVGLLDTGHHFKNLVLQVEMIIQPIKSDIHV